MIHNFLSLIKEIRKSYSSVIGPLIFIFIFLTFSSREISIANNRDIHSINENLSDASLVKKSHLNEVDTNGIYYEQNGGSSWYSHKFINRTTSNGERYSKNKLTAAHKKLPFGSIVKITNKKNGKSTFVRINDRGPFYKKRIIDLSHKTAVQIGALGNPNVKLETVIPQKSFENDEKVNNCFIAYSHDEKPKLSPESNFDIISEYDDFDTAVENLDKKDLFNREKYLLVEAENYGDSKVDLKYFIGYKKHYLSMFPMNLLLSITAK